MLPFNFFFCFMNCSDLQLFYCLNNPIIQSIAAQLGQHISSVNCIQLSGYENQDFNVQKLTFFDKLHLSVKLRQVFICSAVHIEYYASHYYGKENELMQNDLRHAQNLYPPKMSVYPIHANNACGINITALQFKKHATCRLQYFLRVIHSFAHAVLFLSLQA